MKQAKQHNNNDTGFKVPKGYFDNLDDTLVQVAKLKTKAKASGFSVPNTYFDTLDNKILDRLNVEKTTRVIPLFSKKNLVYISSIAAAVILLFTLTFNKTTTNWNNLDADTVENYMLLEGIDTHEIASLLPDTDLDEADFVDLDFNEETIENYLLNHANIEDLIIEEE